jgi:PAS domain S-box-containing protein
MAIKQQSTEESLNQTIQLQARLIELAHDAIIVRDLASIIVSWNRGAEELYGWTAQEAIGQETHELLKTQFPESREAVDQFFAADEQWQGELIHTRCDSAQVVVESRQVLLRDDEGHPLAILEINRDVTERKQRERESQEQYRTLIRTSREQAQFLAEVSKILSSTLDYQETLANISRLVVPRLADWFSVDLLNADGQFDLVEVYHKDPAQVQWARALREQFPIDLDAPAGNPAIVRTGKSEFYPDITDDMLVAGARNVEELAIARQLGMTSAMSVPLVARGKTIGVVTLVSTEADRKYNERDLALAEEIGRRAGVALDNARLYREAAQTRDQLGVILQGVADGIVVYTDDDQIMYANEAAAQLVGFVSSTSLLDSSADAIMQQFMLSDEQGNPILPSDLPHRRVLAGEMEAQATIGYTPQGSNEPNRWVHVNARPVFDEQGTQAFVITIIHDLTERVLDERRKDEFISMASHELKTPVTSLKGFTNVLQRRMAKSGQGDEQTQHFLERMDAQINKLTRLIDDLLGISRMQAGKLALTMEQVDLDILVREIAENVQASATTHQLLIEGSIQGYVLGDKDRLGQVFINLFTNAIKYSPRAQTVIIRLTRDSEHEQAVVSVQDFGIGIAAVHHKHIFDRFYQVTDPEEKTFPGLGIGLYITRDIVERHQGRIWVESRKGAGATFFVELPLLKDSAQPRHL